MSACCQAKARRRKMANGYAHLGGSLRRPTVAGHKNRSVQAAMAAAAATAARIAKASQKKRSK